MGVIHPEREAQLCKIPHFQSHKRLIILDTENYKTNNKQIDTANKTTLPNSSQVVIEPKLRQSNTQGPSSVLSLYHKRVTLWSTTINL